MDGLERENSFWGGAKKIDRKETVRLAESLRVLMEERILPGNSRYEKISGLWETLVPTELRRHCRISDIRGGQLQIEVDSPSHAHELRLCRIELLRQFWNICPGEKIRQIGIVLRQD